MNNLFKIIKNRYFIFILILSICIESFYFSFRSDSMPMLFNSILLQSTTIYSIFLATVIADIKFNERQIFNIDQKKFIFESYMLIIIITIITLLNYVLSGVTINMDEYEIGIIITIIAVIIYNYIQEIIILLNFPKDVFLILNIIFLGIFMFVDFVFMYLPFINNFIFTFYEKAMEDLNNNVFSIENIVAIIFNSVMVITIYLFLKLRKRKIG